MRHSTPRLLIILFSALPLFSAPNPSGNEGLGSRGDARDNDGIRLAISPGCVSPWKGSNKSSYEINAGVNWSKMRTLVVFGDSYTQVGNGGTGGPPAPLIFDGKNPSAGGRYSNGPTWIEHLVDSDAGFPRQLLSYARSGATTDHEIWPNRAHADDFPSQISRFLASNITIKPQSTLFVGYFGINDFWSVASSGDRMDQAGRRAAELLEELNRITGASNFLWLGVQFSKPATLEYQHAVSTGLRRMHQRLGINYAFVDTGRFFGSIEETYGMFGYTSPKHCLEGGGSNVEDECDDPNHTVYYLGHHPSKQTHRLLAQYTYKVLTKCMQRKTIYDSLSLYGQGVTGMLQHYVHGDSRPLLLFLVVAVLAGVVLRRPLMRPSSMIAKFFNQTLLGGTP